MQSIPSDVITPLTASSGPKWDPLLQPVPPLLLHTSFFAIPSRSQSNSSFQTIAHSFSTPPCPCVIHSDKLRPGVIFTSSSCVLIPFTMYEKWARSKKQAGCWAYIQLRPKQIFTLCIIYAGHCSSEWQHFRKWQIAFVCFISYKQTRAQCMLRAY